MPLSYPVPRRRFLTGAGAAAAGVGLAGLVGPVLLLPEGAAGRVPTGPVPRLPAGLFSLGVASGDPLPDGVVLWTRLAPRPLDGGGMPDAPVPVRWEVADDDRFQRVVRTGAATARPALAHSVHVDVRGLRPGAQYFYRFLAGTEASPTGQTRTAPAPGARPQALRWAFASCQNWQDGLYTAYRGLIREDVAFVAFVGDYLYESNPRTDTIRRHEGTGEPYSLSDYRNRHAQYRTDPDLAAAHAAVPWILTWDDHEVDNNWAGAAPQDPDRQTAEAFRARKAAAFQAYYEHLPIRTRPPVGGRLRLYRRLRFGDLATVHVLDTRQYRSDQPATLAEAEGPHLTMTGTAQEKWLVEGLANAGSRWNLLANQVMWASNDRTIGPATSYDLDNWDGYRAQRRRLLEFFGTGEARNPVVLTGDRHATWVCDLKPDFDAENSPVVGAEITGTSITSGGDADTAAFHRAYDTIQAESPHWKYIDNRRGYVVCDLTPDALHARLRVVDTVWSATGGAMSTAASFVIESDRPGITLDGPVPPATLVSRTATRRYGVDDDQQP